ncbi:hypothetical protein [Lactobacillus crispatus]|uniref:hypothetical protein n=1 Tax=Lactobacillus crispatus TaxID=47770 RepID=UPI000B5DB1C9|nr:hypothetical protein [Lactobacillus crispatus]OXC25132.1 hypothetical protein AYP83_07825 [Lactobacillus crispatus]
MKLNKKSFWISGTLILSAITGIFFYVNGHSTSTTTIGVILAGITLYFLFQTGQLYKKIWIKILVYLIDAVWILIVLLIISLFIY